MVQGGVISRSNASEMLNKKQIENWRWLHNVDVIYDLDRKSFINEYRVKNLIGVGQREIENNQKEWMTLEEEGPLP